MVARQANAITQRSIRIEADKHVFEWGQRCLNVLSRASSLRLISEGQITEEAFRQERRELRATLFALTEEGALVFVKDGAGTNEPILAALRGVTDCLDGRRFEPPAADDYNTVRQPQNATIRQHTRAFMQGVQAKVGDEWLAG
jgi:hypothetical protein